MYLDIIAIAIIVLASIVGTFRGFFASFLSLLGFVGSFLLAYLFSDKILLLLNNLFGFSNFIQSIIGPSIGQVVSVVLAFILTFVLVKLLVFVLNHTIGKIFKGRALGGVNKFMGCVLGAAKGGAYVLLILLVLNVASFIPQVKTWTTTTFAETYVVGEVYNWVGIQLTNFFSNNE